MGRCVGTPVVKCDPPGIREVVELGVDPLVAGPIERPLTHGLRSLH